MGSWQRQKGAGDMREFRALTPDRVADLTGPCAPCSFWQTVPHNGHVMEPDPLVLLTDWVRQVTEDWGPPGEVVYVDDVPQGYVLLAPARHVPRLAAFATAPSDPSTLMLLTTCTDPAGSHRDLRKTLVQHAAKEALRHKARSIESIGAKPAAIRRHPCVLEVEALERSGFRIERDHPTYPRLRLDLRTVLSLRDEVAGVAARALAWVPGLKPVQEAPRPDGVTRARTHD